MDECDMIEPLHFLSPLIASLAVGVLLGMLYFQAVRRCADLMVKGEHAVLALALTIGRLALLGATFFCAVRFGALPLLAMLAGTLLGRQWVMRTQQRRRP